MTREEIKKYLEDRKVEVVSDDDKDIIIDNNIIATCYKAYLKIARSFTKFMTHCNGVDIDSVTEKDLDKFIADRDRWIKNYDKRIRSERVKELRKAIKKHREEKNMV